MAITPKQLRFVDEYLVDLNATEAARRAGYVGKWVKTTALDLMAKPELQEAIAAAQAKRVERTGETQDEVLRDLRRVGKAAEESGKFDAAVRAIQLRGQHLGMFSQKVELTGRAGGPVQTQPVPPDLSGLSDDELELLERLAGSRAGGAPAQG